MLHVVVQSRAAEEFDDTVTASGLAADIFGPTLLLTRVMLVCREAATTHLAAAAMATPGLTLGMAAPAPAGTFLPDAAANVRVLFVDTCHCSRLLLLLLLLQLRHWTNGGASDHECSGHTCGSDARTRCLTELVLCSGTLARAPTATRGTARTRTQSMARCGFSLQGYNCSSRGLYRQLWTVATDLMMCI